MSLTNFFKNIERPRRQKHSVVMKELKQRGTRIAVKKVGQFFDRNGQIAAPPPLPPNFLIPTITREPGFHKVQACYLSEFVFLVTNKYP